MEGAGTGAIGLNLSGDNEKVIGGQFVTRGTTGFKELKFPCNFVWEDSSADIYLALNIPTLDIFSFYNGGLWSNIVPSASIVHSFHKTSTGVSSLSRHPSYLPGPRSLLGLSRPPIPYRILVRPAGRLACLIQSSEYLATLK